MDAPTFPRPGDPPRIAVIGDLMLDRYTYGDASRISPEAPIPVLRAEREEISLGGAASVAMLLRAIDVEVELIGVAGADAYQTTLRNLLVELQISDEGAVIDPDRPTTCKHRYVGQADGRHSQQVLRVDHESTSDVEGFVEQKVINLIQAAAPEMDAVLISDYAKGVCTADVLRTAIASCRQHEVPVLIDPNRHGDFSRYRGATLLKPNRYEAATGLGISEHDFDNPIDHAANAVATWGVEAVAITLDRDGLIYADDRFVSHVQTNVHEVYDITGAGDTALAFLGYGYAIGLQALEAMELANRAAGIQVSKSGIQSVGWHELDSHILPNDNKIVDLGTAATFAEAVKRNGKTVVFTNGCFDLFHVGHLQTIEEAAGFGDALIVAINSDASVRALKGPNRPIVNERDRARLIAALPSVDQVIIYDEATPHEILRRIRPNVLVKGGTTDEIVGREIVEGYGGRVEFTSRLGDTSTTALVEEISRSANH